MSKLAKKYPKNPYVLSRMGRLCLETGRKQEALDYFNQIHKIMKSTSAAHPSIFTDQEASFDADLESLCLMNR
jgi:hypothetical protein